MASLLKNILNTGSQVTTEQGEVTVNINLTLTIQIDQDGKVHVSGETAQTPPPPRYIPKPNITPTTYELPDLGEPCEIINFGKEV